MMLEKIFVVYTHIQTHIEHIYLSSGFVKLKGSCKEAVNESVIGLVVKIQVRKREKVEIKTRYGRNMNKVFSLELIKCN